MLFSLNVIIRLLYPLHISTIIVYLSGKGYKVQEFSLRYIIAVGLSTA